MRLSNEWLLTCAGTMHLLKLKCGLTREARMSKISLADIRCKWVSVILRKFHHHIWQSFEVKRDCWLTSTLLENNVFSESFKKTRFCFPGLWFIEGVLSSSAALMSTWKLRNAFCRSLCVPWDFSYQEVDTYWKHFITSAHTRDGWSQSSTWPMKKRAISLRISWSILKRFNRGGGVVRLA